ncbi:hypothetical protein PHLGIDRAFT_466539 [Phlebiopsis gigantea 11061_1 CR5-6]|uniref:RNA-dependent RNA polymerase n=1 Tax=Phlebiopsis gigantea (strain 11061_1 CR5-6) TaxID=745531 RepID=A0A0C3NMH5_PHLG1|nr:hypothetical protein PHLGIDRAFT_466539 [Phlebiopsis gigantea 11061_1 CR5-6]
MGYRPGQVSAAQIRIGGVKGVLGVVQDGDLRDRDIRVRPSMVKIHGHISMNTLNVIKVAVYSKATLNRQAILLLEDRGVSADVLMEIFLEEKRKIEGLNTGFDPARLASISVFPISEAISSRIDDPFVQNVKQLISCRLLSDLKWKAWIEVDQSAYLMAIADETDSLEEGQVFCQIQAPGSDPQVIEGKCTEYRNPCLHPGDIRSVQAVDCHRLRHLMNVIVFSTRGDRDLPNMLSGGDLDGDHYTLIWDERFRIRDECIHEPMDYTAPSPVKSPVPVTLEQTKQHFINLIKNDLLGRVCNAHMALADQRSASDPICLELAGLASQAVDFPKTGVPVKQSQLPLIGKYPDYMGKEYRAIRVFRKQPINSYRSEKALGQIFRSIDPEPLYEEAQGYHGEGRLLGIERSVDCKSYLPAVAMHKARYEFELTGLLRRCDMNALPSYYCHAYYNSQV